MIQLPSDPEHSAHFGFTTTPLFASDQLADAAALARALETFLAFCEEHRLRVPALPRVMPASFPCRLNAAIREHLAKGVQVGRLQVQREDGGCSFGLHWQIAPAGQPVRIEPPRPPAALNRDVRVSLIVQPLGEAPRFMVSALHPDIGAGGEFIRGAEPGEHGFTEARLRAFLTGTYGMSDAEIKRAVQRAKDIALPGSLRRRASDSRVARDPMRNNSHFTPFS